MNNLDALLIRAPLVGVDEVGRGPLAGPVVAAAVILDHAKPIQGLKDSKKLSHKKRIELADMIKNNARDFAVGRAEPEEIDKINILQASLLAMKRAVDQLIIEPSCVLVDGNHKPNIEHETHAIIKGDSLVQEISAASILAKVERDTEMIEMDKIYPGYDFAKHKGYPPRRLRTRIDSCARS